MNIITDITGLTDSYNLHSHTQFCDGRADMATMAAAAVGCGMKAYGFTPHSPLPPHIKSGCNMAHEAVGPYKAEAARLRDRHAPETRILTGMEADFISPDFGPHTDLFQHMGLDYIIGSVHFVPTRFNNAPVDCDGRYERFAINLKEAFESDLRYVVEKYFEQVILMTERGGFDILGHLDKIAANASQADPKIEDNRWYEALIDDIISMAASSGTTVEINTKAFAKTGRFFPAERWWPKLIAANVPLAVNSDAHSPELITAGREEAFRRLDLLKKPVETINRD